MRLLVAVDGADALAAALERDGHAIEATVAAGWPARAAGDRVLGVEGEALLRGIADADALVLEVRRDTVTAAVVAVCDRASTRIVPLCADDAAVRLAEAFGLEQPLARTVEAWRLSDVLRAAPSRPAADPTARTGPGVIAVWGPAGAPGRSTIAAELASSSPGAGGTSVWSMPIRTLHRWPSPWASQTTDRDSLRPAGRPSSAGSTHGSSRG